MIPLIPRKLKPGAHLRVIAPARSLSLISEEGIASAQARLEELGFKVSFSRNVRERDEFVSSPVASRLADLNEAFLDPDVDGILTVIGGYNSNQLLAHIDYDLIARNPKVLCGYSDITALQNAILTRAGVVTYSGPHFSTFSQKHGLDYTIDGFRKCLAGEAPFEIEPSSEWSDDPMWFIKQDEREFRATEPYRVLREGAAEGTIIGGNLCTFQLLCGTPFMPPLEDTILFVEECDWFGATTDVAFDRLLQSILHQPGARGIRALVVGRFARSLQMPHEKLERILAAKPELMAIPIVAGVDFGHTFPLATLPIGGRARVEAADGIARISILRH